LDVAKQKTKQSATPCIEGFSPTVGQRGRDGLRKEKKAVEKFHMQGFNSQKTNKKTTKKKKQNPQLVRKPKGEKLVFLSNGNRGQKEKVTKRGPSRRLLKVGRVGSEARDPENENRGWEEVRTDFGYSGIASSGGLDMAVIPNNCNREKKGGGRKNTNARGGKSLQK